MTTVQFRKYACAAMACASMVVTLSGAATAQSAPSRAASASDSAVVILISLDGFRRSYLDTDSVPTLHALARTGVKADAMIPSFPTLTFPNHYTLVTGLYPEHHGIVGNTVYDPDFNATFTMSNAESKLNRWWGGEPIWVTAEKQGEQADVMFWPGSEVDVEGIRPDKWKPFDERMPFAARVDTVLSWLDLPAGQRPSFVGLYFNEPDHAGHEYGPDAPQTAAAAAMADSAVGRLVDGLKKRGLYDKVNVIVVSDHGMSALSPDRTVYLDDVVDPATLHIVSMSPVLMVSAKDGDNAALLAKLRKLPHVTSWLEADVPARLHFNEGRRITPVVAVADDGWTITTHSSRGGPRGGAHGYDNDNASMRALFVAHGPAFKPGTTIGAFPNVDVYDLVAHILGLAPAPNDGTLQPFESVLRK